MKSAVLHNTGDISQLDKNLLVEDFPTPEPNKDEVLVNIRSASLNHRDLWITKGLYSKIKLPVILGSDGAGILENGDEVVINPSINWGDSEAHQSPTSYEILGLPQNGTLAEYTKVDKSKVYPKPAHLDFDQASALPLVGLTAYRAVILKANVQPSDKVLITGAGGGVSTMALLYCIAIGAETYLTSGSEAKIAQAIKLGAKGGVNYKEEIWGEAIKEMTGGVTVVIDSSSGDTIAKALDFTTYGARIVSYGATNGTVKDFDMRRVYWKQLQILGSTMGSDKDFADMLAFVNEYKIIPIVDKVYPLDDVHSAFRRMNDGEQFGKIVVKMA
ncbi:MAG: zinc-binding dehydrogenase [Ignavibacteriae bacterium]|nr:zinc-binding dehydrogenase [Ignavibacteriota bacterium]MCB9243472.1 zinc-binding dehydrogenase [Ignavibacteriales bacterium]